MSGLSHYDESGRARMVDVGGKPPGERMARASALVALPAEVLAALPSNPKGDPLEVARLAGIMAAKRTSELIPLCHPLPLTLVEVTAEVSAEGVRIEALARTTAPTGVEMEALTAAAVAALTVYDMTKALDKGIEIRHVRLEAKEGGKSGSYRRVQAAGGSGPAASAPKPDTRRTSRARPTSSSPEQSRRVPAATPRGRA